jgi:hypothetical protein
MVHEKGIFWKFIFVTLQVTVKGQRWHKDRTSMYVHEAVQIMHLYALERGVVHHWFLCKWDEVNQEDLWGMHISCMGCWVCTTNHGEPVDVLLGCFFSESMRFLPWLSLHKIPYSQKMTQSQPLSWFNLKNLLLTLHTELAQFLTQLFQICPTYMISL